MSGLEGKIGQQLSSSSLSSYQVLSTDGLMVGSLLCTELRKYKIPTKSARTEHPPAHSCGWVSSTSLPHHLLPSSTMFSSCLLVRLPSVGTLVWTWWWACPEPLRSEDSSVALKDLLPIYFIFSTAFQRMDNLIAWALSWLFPACSGFPTSGLWGL